MKEDKMKFEELARIRNKEELDKGIVSEEEYLEMERILDVLKQSNPGTYAPLN